MKTNPFILICIFCAGLISLSGCSPKTLENRTPLSLAANGDEGYEVGNGGSIVECSEISKNSQPKAQFLDFFEAGQMDLKVDLKAGETVDEKVQLGIDRLKTIDPERHRRLESYFADFYDEVSFSHHHLDDIPDDGPVRLPHEGCQLRQIVDQREPMPGRPHRYYIQENLWNKLDDTNKAVLILHEIIYRDFGRPQGGSSRYVRTFNIHLITNQIPDSKFTAYANFLKEMKVFPQVVPVNGIPCDMNTVEQNGPHVTKCKASTDRKFELKLTDHSIQSEDISSSAYVFLFSKDRVILEGQNLLKGAPQMSLSSRCRYNVSEADSFEIDPETGKIHKIVFYYSSEEHNRITPPNCIENRVLQDPEKISLIFHETSEESEAKSLVLSGVKSLEVREGGLFQMTCEDGQAIEISRDELKKTRFCQRPDFLSDGIQRVKSAYDNFDSTFTVVCADGRKLRLSRGDFLLGSACQIKNYAGLKRSRPYKEIHYNFPLGSINLSSTKGFLVASNNTAWKEVSTQQMRNDQWLEIKNFPSSQRRLEGANRVSETHFSVECVGGLSSKVHQDKLLFGTPCSGQKMASDAGHRVYTNDSNGECVYRFDPDYQRGSLIQGNCLGTMSIESTYTLADPIDDLIIAFTTRNGEIDRYQVLVQEP